MKSGFEYGTERVQCGCRVYRDDPQAQGIEFCPKHAAAELDSCLPPYVHVYVRGDRYCQCRRKKDGVTLAESDWLKALAFDPRAVQPEGP